MENESFWKHLVHWIVGYFYRTNQLYCRSEMTMSNIGIWLLSKTCLKLNINIVLLWWVSSFLMLISHLIRLVHVVSGGFTPCVALSIIHIVTITVFPVVYIVVITSEIFKEKEKWCNRDILLSVVVSLSNVQGWESTINRRRINYYQGGTVHLRGPFKNHVVLKDAIYLVDVNVASYWHHQ